MAKTSSRKSKKAPDFKRIKAKVGKRAIKPANVTDTSFRAASLVVTKQQVGSAENDVTNKNITAVATDPTTVAVLYSAKGKSLQELTAQLSHPASNVRISAIKGMNAIVNDFPHVFVSSYYYLLFPAVAKCLVDSDATARQLSRNLLRDILRQALEPSSSQQQQQQLHHYQQQSSSISPYIPLLLAYILSALNSLDRPTRMDGAKALITLFEHNRSHSQDDAKQLDRGDGQGGNFDAFGDACLVDEEDIARLLPALVGLMSMDPHQHQVAPKSKNSKKASAMESERCVILKAFVAVLRAVSFSNQDMSSSRILNATFSSQVKGCSVVLLRRQFNSNATQRTMMKLSSIHDLTPFFDDIVDDRRGNTSLGEITREAISDDGRRRSSLLPATSVMTELLSKLCDHWVETAQAGGGQDDVGVDQGRRATVTMIGKNIAEEWDLVVTAIHLVWKTVGLRALTEKRNQKSDGKEMVQWIKQWRHLVSLLLEAFPAVAQDHQPSREEGLSLCERLNLTMCTTVMEISSALIQWDEETDKSYWMGPILEYLLHRIKREGEGTRHNASVVHVLARLLLLRHGHDGGQKLLLSSKKCKPILASLQSFLVGSNDHHKDLDESRIRSPAGPRIAQLVRDMVTELYHLDPFNLPDEDSRELNKLLLTMLNQLPFYLKAWRGDFSLDSYAILLLLTDVVRRINPDTSDATKQKFLQRMRQDLSHLFTTANASTTLTAKKMRKRKHDPELAESRSIFEQYPPSIQRQLMGLISLLQSPTPETISCLGIICARGGTNLNDVVSPETEDFAVQVLHGIRKTLSMQTYMGFLVQSTGILSSNATFATPAPTSEGRDTNPEKTTEQRQKAVWTSDACKLVLSYDRKIRRTCWYLSDCGSALKILPMLHSVLLQWLDVSLSASSPLLFTARARGAIAILAWFSHDIQRFSDLNSVLGVLPEFKQFLIVGLCRLLETLPTLEADGDEAGLILVDSFLRPIISLLQSEPLLLKSIFVEQIAQMKNEATRASKTGIALEMLLLIVRDPLLKSALNEQKQGMVEIVEYLEKEGAGGPCEGAARNLRTYVENTLTM